MEKIEIYNRIIQTINLLEENEDNQGGRRECEEEKS